jgi:hypothetical protein
VRPGNKLGRYLSKIRTGCANERPVRVCAGGTGQLVSLQRSPTMSPNHDTSQNQFLDYETEARPEKASLGLNLSIRIICS